MAFRSSLLSSSSRDRVSLISQKKGILDYATVKTVREAMYVAVEKH
jgi:hypothetical protein